MRSPSNGHGSPRMQGQVGSHHGGVRDPRCGLWAVGCGLWADCYHQNLFEAQLCVTALAAVIQRPDLCDDFRRVGESLPSEAADPPSLSLE